MEWITKNLKLVIVAVVVLVVGIIAFGIASWINSVNNTAFSKQRDVIAKYNIFQNELSTCLDNTRLAAGIAQEEYSQVSDMLESIVGARYGGDEADALSGDAFVSVLVEQYPEIDRSLWKQFMTKALGCRDQTKGVNGDLQALAGRFDTWTSTGSLLSKPIRNNYPDDRLKVQGPDGVLTGRDALDFIVTPITTADARDALVNKEMPDQSDDLFGGDEDQ